MKINDSLIIMGDFNLPTIKWKLSPSNYLYPDPSHSSISSSTVKLLDSYNVARISQLNTVLNNNDRMLDLCFGSFEGDVRYVLMEAPSPLVKTSVHHPPLLIEANGAISSTFKEPVEMLYYDFKHGDYRSMNTFLSHINWHDFIDLDLNSSTVTLSNILLYAIDQFVPKRSRKSSPQPPWSNSRLKQ